MPGCCSTGSPMTSRTPAGIFKPELIVMLRREFRLDWGGIHGAPHWARVRINGLALAARTGARADVVECFALLHDSQRLDDGHDADHGVRAADFVRRINHGYLHLDAAGLEQLVHACKYHSAGLSEADATVQTCWDADRLDLGRVGIRPDPTRLCTAAAREPAVIAQALARSLRHGAADADIDPAHPLWY